MRGINLRFETADTEAKKILAGITLSPYGKFLGASYALSLGRAWLPLGVNAFSMLTFDEAKSLLLEIPEDLIREDARGIGVVIDAEEYVCLRKAVEWYLKNSTHVPVLTREFSWKELRRLSKRLRSVALAFTGGVSECFRWLHDFDNDNLVKPFYHEVWQRNMFTDMRGDRFRFATGSTLVVPEELIIDIDSLLDLWSEARKKAKDEADAVWVQVIQKRLALHQQLFHFAVETQIKPWLRKHTVEV